MSWDNDNKGPWGSRPGGDNNWNGKKGKNNGHGGRGGQEPPDLDDVLRQAQEKFGDMLPGSGGAKAGLGLILLLLAGLWAATGFYIIVPGEHGVIQRFGAWDRTQANEGLGYHMPWPIETLTKLNVTEVRRMGVGFIDYGGSSAQKRDVPEESLMLTSDANIVDLNMEVQWNIKSAEDYLFNIRDQENTIKKVAESAIREVVGQTPMFPIITQARTQIAQDVRKIMEENLDQYKSGVNIMQVLIQKAEVHPDVQNAFQDVQSAKQDAEGVQNQAEAYKEDILPRANGKAIQMRQEAEGYKESVIARATGNANRFEAVYKAYLSGKNVTKQRIYLETMEEVLQHAQKIILDEDGKGSGVVPYLPLNELKPAAGNRK